MLEAIMDILILALLLSILWDRGWLSRLGDLRPLSREKKGGRASFALWKAALSVFVGFWFCSVLFVFGTHVGSELSEADSLFGEWGLFMTHFFEIVLEFSALVSLLLVVFGILLFSSTKRMAGGTGLLIGGSVSHLGILVAGVLAFASGGRLILSISQASWTLPALGLFLFSTQSFLFWAYYRCFLAKVIDPLRS